MFLFYFFKNKTQKTHALLLLLWSCETSVSFEEKESKDAVFNVALKLTAITTHLNSYNTPTHEQNESKISITLNF
jgi:hypothetical protein